MSKFDCDYVVAGSGFGRAVAQLPPSNRDSQPHENTGGQRVHTRALIRIAGVTLATSAIAGPQLAAGATHAGTLHISAQLNVTDSPPPVCQAAVCAIHNSGTGRVTPLGRVTFTTAITADANQAPCGSGSQWVNRIIRIIHTSQGVLVPHEAGLQSPQPEAGPRVDAVWTVDGADSTGIFAGAQGRGYDTAYPTQDTAAPHAP